MPIHIASAVCKSVLAILLSTLIACGKRSESVVEARQAPPPGALGEKVSDGIVRIKDAEDLQQIKIEPVRSVLFPEEEVVAPAKIEAIPSRVGHALLPVAGRIARVFVKIGDSVTKGQPLLTIDSPTVAEAEAAYLQADAALRQAELSAAKAEADLARLTDLYEHQAVALKELLAARTSAALARASVEQARSAKEQAQRRLELLGLKPGALNQAVTVSAPLSGKVLEVNTVSGEFRNDTNSPLITIADLSRVWATSDVHESKIRFCKLGGWATLELIAYPGEIFRARVVRIADTVDKETRTVKVSAELDNPSGKLRPEMFGQLHYAGNPVPTPWIPQQAVVRLNEKDCVFSERSPGEFVLTAVKLGPLTDGGYPVLAGLKEGDRIVTSGAIYLRAAL